MRRLALHTNSNNVEKEDSITLVKLQKLEQGGSIIIVFLEREEGIGSMAAGANPDIPQMIQVKSLKLLSCVAYQVSALLCAHR